MATEIKTETKAARRERTFEFVLRVVELAPVCPDCGEPAVRGKHGWEHGCSQVAS